MSKTGALFMDQVEATADRYLDEGMDPADAWERAEREHGCALLDEPQGQKLSEEDIETLIAAEKPEQC